MKVSILTPSFNSGKYLERAIQSVLIQTYKNWEHIVMDGQSKDETIQILNRYPHLIWESAPDKGQSDAMNKAFDRASGELIMYLNADDELESGILEKVVTFFEKDSTADMVVCNLRVSNQGVETYREPVERLEEILQYWPCRFPANPVAYAYKRSLQIQVGHFPIHNHFTMDYWFLLRAYKLGNVRKMETVGGTFYLDGNNKSSDAIRAKDQLRVVRNEFVKENLLDARILKFLAKNSVEGSMKTVRKLTRRLTRVLGNH